MKSSGSLMRDSGSEKRSYKFERIPAYQNSSRIPTCPVRFPEFSADCTELSLPNAGLLMFTFGGRKLGWFGRFVKVPSIRRRSRSVSEKLFDRPAAITTVPGP